MCTKDPSTKKIVDILTSSSIVPKHHESMYSRWCYAFCIPCARAPEYFCALLNRCYVYNEWPSFQIVHALKDFVFIWNWSLHIIKSNFSTQWPNKGTLTCYLLQIMPYIFLFYFSNPYTFKNYIINLLETVRKTDFWGPTIEKSFAWIMFANCRASNTCVKIKPWTILTSFKTSTYVL